ncbi:MAG: hypothetical protein E6G97_18180 [Alphaproteobacteria bacterium]|nr:MAG: hypothetical protein E6G97_18180 [Alphaproteobacteria bacterium]
MKEIEDLIFDWIDTDLAYQAARSRGYTRSRDDKNYVAMHQARAVWGRAWRALAILTKPLYPKSPLEELFADYQAFRERHGCQIDPKDIPAPFSQELAELRERCSVALLALRGAYHKQFDEKR